MIEQIRKQYPQYSDMSDEDLQAALTRKLGKANHEELSGPGVVDAALSHLLQAAAPDVKPVVKGTKPDVLRMKQSDQIAPGSIIHIGKDGSAYIINVAAVQDLYGASPQQSVKMARQDLEAGGEMESILLGYPKREGVEQLADVAVTVQGDVVTDPAEMKRHSEEGNVIWAAEGAPGDVEDHAGRVAQRWKEIGGAE